MKPSKTQANGTKTANVALRHSSLAVENKDPAFDYSFRTKASINDGGGMDEYGFQPVGAANSSGEQFSLPGIKAAKTRGKKQIVLQDTVLCRRPIETANYFKSLENQKYNSQKQLINTVASRYQAKLRELDPRATVTDESGGNEFTQRVGKTE